MGEKRATRWKAEVVDGEGHVVWEVLAHDWPEQKMQAALAFAGLKVRRASTPQKEATTLLYSELDPENSIKAAREHAARNETLTGNTLMFLLDHDAEWVDRDVVRRIGGDSGDRRVRELRQRNWPIEMEQLGEARAWHVRLVLPPLADGNGQTGLF
jgi:hypothetical protein